MIWTHQKFPEQKLLSLFHSLRLHGLKQVFLQVAPNKMYICVKDSPEMRPGKQFEFYGAYTMEKTGEGTVVEAVKNEDESINQAFWDALKKAAVLTWEDTVIPWLVTLDRDIQISELEVLDCPQVSCRPPHSKDFHKHLSCLSVGLHETWKQAEVILPCDSRAQ